MKMNSEDGKTGSTTTGTAPSLPVRRAKVFQAFLLIGQSQWARRANRGRAHVDLARHHVRHHLRLVEVAGEADFVADFGNVRLDPRIGCGRSAAESLRASFSSFEARGGTPANM
jgi:hypothetical protein